MLSIDQAYEQRARQVVELMAGKPCNEVLLRQLFEVGYLAGKEAGLELADSIADGVRKFTAGRRNQHAGV